MEQLYQGRIKQAEWVSYIKYMEPEECSLSVTWKRSNKLNGSVTLKT